MQVDLSTNVTLVYSQNTLRGGNKIYHAGCTNLVTKLLSGQNKAQNVKRVHNYADMPPNKEKDDPTPPEECQYITHNTDKGLTTERVVRVRGDMPMTEAELAHLETEDGDAVGSVADAILRNAQKQKKGGNEAFVEGEYMQASAYYTRAIDLAPNEEQLLATCLSNRAACFLKLGHHEKAVDDASAAIVLDPENKKAWFRKGLAYHADKDYPEALRALEHALKLAPKNKQIKEAIKFAEAMYAKQMAKRKDKYSS